MLRAGHRQTKVFESDGATRTGYDQIARTASRCRGESHLVRAFATADPASVEGRTQVRRHVDEVG